MSLMFLYSCDNQENSGVDNNISDSENPFLTEWDTPFGVPPFDKIDTSHYIPAFEKAIEEHKKEIEAIINNPDAANFENTIYALDQSGELLKKVENVFYNLNGANTNPAMQAIARKISPMVTEHEDQISFNEKLFQRIKSVYEKMDSLNLDDLQKRVTTKYYQDFVRNGALLNEQDKKRLGEINKELATKGLQFDENLLAETNNNFKLVIDKEEDLAGLPEDVKAAAAIKAKELGLEGKWVFTLQKPSMIPFLQYAENRELRKQLYTGYFMRGNHDDKFDNKQIVKDIMNLRAEKARLLGYKNFAEYKVEVNMAKTPENVFDLLYKIIDPALNLAKSERDEMQKIIYSEGGNFKLESWDWWYYAEKLKKQKYNIDESEIKPYLSLTNVIDGMFHVANQLYDINFEKLSDVPVYHPEVEVYEIKDNDGSHLGILYMDYYPRDGKDVGAWCTSFRDQGYKDGKKIYPVISIVCNFTRPTGDTPALLSWDETETLFHEFGHALHALFTDGKYYRIAGNVPHDMVELPSQIMENWAGEPEVLKYYAKHYETGEPMPQELIDKINGSSLFNQGFATTEYVAAAILDMKWHSLTEPQPDIDVNAFEKKVMDEIGLIPEILPRYRSPYFAHMAGGYAAGYYVYIWAEVLDADAFYAFKESGDIYNKELASKFRKYILTEGGNDDGMVQYIKFRGQEPSIEPLLIKRGLKK